MGWLLKWLNDKERIIKRVGIVIFFLVLCLVPLVVKGDYYLHILIMSGVSAILCMGWVLLLRVGLFSLAQAAFLGIGAYSSAILVLRLGISFWFTMLIAGLFTALVAFSLGVIILRLKGLYFAVVTFAFGEVVRNIYLIWISLFGGIDGISGIPRPNPLFGLAFVSKVEYYYLIMVLTSITGIVMYRIDHSRGGRIFRAIGHNSDLAQSQGMNIRKYKVINFTIASFFAGIAGSFLAHYWTTVYPNQFGLWESMLVQIKATVGGVGTIVLGPFIGAIVMTIVSEALRGYMAGLEPLFFGLFLIMTVFFLPGGLESLLRIKKYFLMLK